MKLSQYVVELCKALETSSVPGSGTTPHNITVTLDHQHIAYRRVIASALAGIFCGPSSAVSDNLFSEKEQLRQNYQNALQQAFKAPEPIKPKRDIKKTLKKVKADKKKLEEAMTEVRRKYREKKAAKLASVDGGMLAEKHG